MNKDFILKAHKEGDIHPNGKWVWRQAARGGKGDWRTIPKSQRSGVQTANNGGDGGNQPQPAQNPQAKQSTGNKPQSQTQQPKQAKGFEDMNPDEITDFANSAKTSALAAVVNNKILIHSIKNIYEF